MTRLILRYANQRTEFDANPDERAALEAQGWLPLYRAAGKAVGPIQDAQEPKAKGGDDADDGHWNTRSLFEGTGGGTGNWDVGELVKLR